MISITQAGVDNMIANHEKYAVNLAGGKRADFSGMNLRRMNFYGHNLNGAIFHAADCRGANFNNCNLFNANFTGARLERATFNGARIECAKGNGTEIISLTLGMWDVVFTKDVGFFGCKEWPMANFLNVTQEELAAMDQTAVAWYKQWHKQVQAIYEASF